jgi:hypothetical protein
VFSDKSNLELRINSKEEENDVLLILYSLDGVEINEVPNSPQITGVS